MDAIHFIEENKEKFFHWLYEVYPLAFPRVCEDAADILGCWLFHKFPNESIEILSGSYDGWSHAWIEVNGQIVDFTISQFLGGMDEKVEEGMTEKEFFQRHFLKYVPSPLIGVALANMYRVEEGLFVCEYDRAKYVQKQGASFETYLDEIFNNRVREKMYDVLKAAKRMPISELQNKSDYSRYPLRFEQNFQALLDRNVFGISEDHAVFTGYDPNK